jgi:hypothetical protein
MADNRTAVGQPLNSDCDVEFRTLKLNQPLATGKAPMEVLSTAKVDNLYAARAAEADALGGIAAASRLELCLARKQGVDVGAVAKTALYTVPAGKTVVITKIILWNASGTFNQATDPIFNIGWNSTASGVVASATYVTPTTADGVLILVPKAESVRGIAADVLNFDVTTAATASTTCFVDVFGYINE